MAAGTGFPYVLYDLLKVCRLQFTLLGRVVLVVVVPIRCVCCTPSERQLFFFLCFWFDRQKCVWGKSSCLASRSCPFHPLENLAVCVRRWVHVKSAIYSRPRSARPSPSRAQHVSPHDQTENGGRVLVVNPYFFRTKKWPCCR